MRQQAPWTSEDVTAVQTIGNILGPVRVLSHEETPLNETDQAKVDNGFGADFGSGDDSNGWTEATGGNAAPTASYPEYPYSLADHVYTWSPKLPDNSMLVIRSQTADGLVEAVEAVAPLAQRLTAAWRGAIGQPAAAAPAPQGGVNYSPQMPPPNQPFPGQPAWQQAGAPAAPAPQQWAPPAQQGAQLPQGWYKLTVPFPQKAAFDAIVGQYSFKKGDPGKNPQAQVSWQPAVKSWFCSPEIAQAFAQFNPVVAQ